MIGPPDFHPFGYSARWPVVAGERGSSGAFASYQFNTAPGLRRKILLLAARLRRSCNAGVAAAIAHQAAWLAQQQFDQRQLDSRRIYRCPIDQLVAKLTRHRGRAV